MGSCYSCRSNGGTSQSNNNTKYTTVAMATTVEDSIDHLPISKDKRKLASTFHRASAGTGSFGFKRRIPAAVLKSTSQERTSELVSVYESKIAGPPSSITGPRLQGIPRYGCGKDSTSHTIAHIPNSAGPDDNCNIHVTITSAKLQDNRTQSSRYSPKTVVSKFGYTSNKSSRDGSPNSQTGSSRRRIHQSDDLKNGNDSSSNENRSHESVSTTGKSVLLSKTVAKAPLKFKTQITSLPQPQVAVVGSKSKSNGIGIVEPMQISSENIPEDENLAFEVDSGIGNSVSDRKTEEDAETLAEIDQIEGDTLSLASRSKDRTPERSSNKTTKVESSKLVLRFQPSGIARPKQSAAVTKVLQERNLNKKVGQLSGLQQLKSYGGGGGATKSTSETHNIVTVANNRPANFKSAKIELNHLGKGRQQQQQQQRGKVVKQLGENDDDWKIITEIVASDIEKIEISAITLGSHKTNNSKPDIVKKSQAKIIDGDVLSTDQTSATSLMKRSNTSGIFSDSESCENSLKDSGGLCSPPSDRDFLIDDEISDQPALMACQTFDTAGGEADLTKDHVGLLCRRQNWADIDEQGGLPALALPSLSMRIARRRSSSLDILSPCSSLGSDDLMMDFDRTDDGHGGGNERSAGKGENKEDNFPFQFGRFVSQPQSPTVGVILEEWGAFVGNDGVDGSNQDGKPKLRALRTNSCSESTNAVMGSPCGEGGPDQSRRSPAATPSSNVPKQISVSFDADGDDTAIVGSASYRAMCQDITNTKTMLLRLRRVLQEADTLNPFDSSSKKGLFMNLANNDPPEGDFMNGIIDTGDDTTSVAKIEQENADLRRQVVFFQQQLEERDRTIKLLQQQMVKSVAPQQKESEKEFCNSACQTERPKQMLTSSLSAASTEDNAFCNTVSFKYMYGLSNVVELYSRSD